MIPKRLGPKAAQILQRVASANANGETPTKAAVLDPSTPIQTKRGQELIVDRLLASGLLENMNGPTDPIKFFEGHGMALVITDDGKEVLAARAGKLRARGDG